MFICLSSGASPQYRHDILRALALPKGAQLQFRYDLKWIAQAVKDQLSKGKLNQPADALIAFIDQRDKTRIPELVPCRFAEITEAQTHGTTVSLILTVGDFARSDNLASFNAEVQSASGGALPKWQSNNHIVGAYWLELANSPLNVSVSSKLGDWELIIRDIENHAEFATEKTFYTILGVRQLGSSKDILPKTGTFSLKPRKDYECSIYNFHPKTAPTGTILNFSCPSKSLIRFTTSASLTVDSRYDLKRVRFNTGRPIRAEQTIISIHRHESGQSGNGTWDFDLPLQVGGSFIPTLYYGLALGVLLATPQTVAALSNPSLNSENQAVIVIVSWISGLLAGVLAAFGVRRSV